MNTFALIMLGLLNLLLAGMNWRAWELGGSKLCLVVASINAFAGLACLVTIEFTV